MILQRDDSESHGRLLRVLCCVDVSYMRGPLVTLVEMARTVSAPLCVVDRVHIAWNGGNQERFLDVLRH